MNRRAPTKRGEDSHMTNAEATITENAATVAEQGAHVAPEKASSKKGATQKKCAPKGQKAAKGGKAKAPLKKGAKASKKAAKSAQAKEASTPRAESKGAKILEMIGRPKGATLSEIAKATDWQKHSIRASYRPPPRSTVSRSSPPRPRPAIAFTRSKSRSFKVEAATCEGGGFLHSGNSGRPVPAHRRRVPIAELIGMMKIPLCSGRSIYSTRNKIPAPGASQSISRPKGSSRPE